MTAWILNLKNRALSQYQGYDFNSLATLNGMTLGASKDGIFVLGGLTDNGAPIECSFETPTSDYSTPALKNIPDIYVTLSSSTGRQQVDTPAPIRVKTITEGGLVRTYDATAPVYRGNTGLSGQGGDGFYMARVRLSRGVVGRYWGIVVENVNGALINVLSITPVIASLR
ncbi:MAG: hypothetical protein HQL02_03870 [Nitrospirae bacterium]|nr:hypothetical protein [Nitrospirota bacterium]